MTIDVPSLILDVTSSPRAAPCADCATATVRGKDLGAGNARDKFAFVSDSALPAKPFSHIHQATGAAVSDATQDE